MSTSLSTPPSVAAQIARLPELPMAEIRALWQKLVGGDTAHPQPPIPGTPHCVPAAGGRVRKVDANLLDRNHAPASKSLVEPAR